uniref:Uncharacterized protein n=1 Tax=Zea mays TaxID=4577 RepID=C0PHJ3_MAIZE|nr:unknown [Zea mays]
MAGFGQQERRQCERPGGPCRRQRQRQRQRHQLLGAAAAQAEHHPDGQPPGHRRRQGLPHREPRLRDHRERPVQARLAEPLQRRGASVHLPQVGHGVPRRPPHRRHRVPHQPRHREHLRPQDAPDGQPRPREALLGGLPLLRRRQLRAHLRRRGALRRLRPHRRWPWHPRDQGLSQRRRHAQHVRRAAAHRQDHRQHRRRVVGDGSRQGGPAGAHRRVPGQPAQPGRRGPVAPALAVAALLQQRPRPPGPDHVRRVVRGVRGVPRARRRRAVRAGGGGDVVAQRAALAHLLQHGHRRGGAARLHRGVQGRALRHVRRGRAHPLRRQ